MHGLLEKPRLVLITTVLLALLITSASCSRTRYRLEADRQVSRLVAEKSNDPRWDLPGFSIGLDPRSRYFDGHDPDREPMPPDDSYSHRYMHCVDGKRGYPRWHEFGDTSVLENPDWPERLPEYVEVAPNGEVRLSLDSAMTLARIHSTAYQQQLETIYLSALDVSAERFRFDVQFFGGNDTFFTHNGSESSRGRFLPPSTMLDRNTLSTETDFQLRRRFATGAELLVGFANSFMWQFAGPDTDFTTSLVNFNIVQPLLRAGGREVALEQLTIVERTLLANLRSFERYRHGFYTNVSIGNLGVSGPQRRGGFFGGTGLTGFTGQGSGGFGEVGGATGFGRAGFGGGAGGATGGGTGFAGGGAGTVGGFIGLLQQLQQVRNTRASLNAQLRTLGLLEANLDAGLIDIAQVDQFRQNIETERANLLQAENGLTNSIESFNTGTLGLPPHFPVALDDEMIKQFQFIDPRSTAVEYAIGDLVDSIGSLPEMPTVANLNIIFARMEELRSRVEGVIALVHADLAALDAKIDERESRMTPDEVKLFRADRTLLLENLGEIESRFQETGPALDMLRMDLSENNRGATTDRMVALASGLAQITQELSLVQARARLESITLDPVTLSPDEALRIARLSRLDWMNNRAALVDTWRLIEFNANALESNLDIVFSGDMGTIGNNPVKFRGETGTLRAGVRFDAPFTRLLERNNYRQVLIDYQRDRRQLIQFEDGVNQTLRQTLRQLEQLRINLEIQRRAVAIAVRRVDQTREVLNEPPGVVEPGQPAAQLGPTAAQNVLTALSDLRNSQNNFMSVWLNYLASRMVLLREMGTMEVDERGMWIDRPIDPSLVYGDEFETLPPAVPQAWLRDAGLGPDQILHDDSSPSPGGWGPVAYHADAAPSNMAGASSYEDGGVESPPPADEQDSVLDRLLHLPGWWSRPPAEDLPAESSSRSRSWRRHEQRDPARRP